MEFFDSFFLINNQSFNEIKTIEILLCVAEIKNIENLIPTLVAVKKKKTRNIKVSP